MRRMVSSWFLNAIIALSFLVPLISFSQMTIKEKVFIDPKPVTVSIPTTAPTGPVLPLVEVGTTGFYDFVRTAMPGVVINGRLTVTPTEIPSQSALEISVGSSKVYKKVNGCGGTAGEVVNPFPIQFVSCGIVGMAGDSWSPYYAICLPQRGAAQARAEITGPTSAKLTVEGSFYDANPPTYWKAVLELTASLDAQYQPSEVKVQPGVTELVNEGSTTVNVEVRNGAGSLMTTCDSPIMVTANLQAQGPYAYLQNGTQTGSSITFPLSGGKASVSLVLDPAMGVIPECSETATLTVAVGDVSGTATVNLKCIALDHFEVTLEKGEIAFTETSKIFVQAKDANNQNIDVDPSTLLRVELLGESAYGTFIKPDGDTLKTTPVELENIRYEDAKPGNVLFAAVAANPATSAKHVIRVSLQDDPSKKGEKEIVVIEQTLKIVMTDPREVRPSIPTEDNDAALVVQRRKGFDVRLTRGGKPVPNHQFRLRTDYVRGSGGHDHDDTPNTVRANNNDNYGSFTAGQSDARRRQLDDVTSADGRFSVTYHASMWGDTMKIYLESRENMLLKDSVSVVERVQGLMLLPDLPNFYSRIGGTCNHHGPSDRLPPGSPCQTPDNNHWGPEDVVNAVFSISLGWLLELPSELPLFVNDMSLPFGGLFDVNGNWIPGHTLHRTGKDVDVRTEFLDPKEPRLGIVIREARNSIEASAVSGNPLFEELCLSWGARKIEIHGTRGTQEEHYHIYF